MSTAEQTAVLLRYHAVRASLLEATARLVCSRGYERRLADEQRQRALHELAGFQGARS